MEGLQPGAGGEGGEVQDVFVAAGQVEMPEGGAEPHKPCKALRLHRVDAVRLVRDAIEREADELGARFHRGQVLEAAPGTDVESQQVSAIGKRGEAGDVKTVAQA